MTLLQIGGTGLISSGVTAVAVAAGHRVTLLNRGKTSKTPVPEGVEVLRADVRDRAAVEAALAGRTFDAAVNWIAFLPEHVEQDLAVLKGRVGQYVFVSSASAYQKPPPAYLITEETPLENPYWEYSRNKAACEARVMRAFREEGVPVTIVRPSLTYGPTQIPLAISCWQAPYTLIRRARAGKPLIVPGDGTSLWVITHHRDFARALLGLLAHPKAAGEAFHITSDEARPWNDYYEAFCAACGAAPRLLHVPSKWLIALKPAMEGSLWGDKSHSTVFDNSKLRRFLPGFRFEVPFASGIRETVAWFDADPSRQAVDDASDREWDRIVQAWERALEFARG